MTRPLCGIFVGGQAKRMGGYPKGLLPTGSSAQPIVLRLAELARSLDLPVVLVGQHAAYEHLGLPLLADRPAGVGPLGGLLALLHAAHGGDVIALACDMPFVTKAFVGKLLDTDLADADAVTAQTAPDAPLESFLARYRPTVMPLIEQKLVEGERSLQRILRGLRVKKLLLSEEEGLVCRDWDRVEELPEDVRATLPKPGVT